ncbi:MAG TPA: HAMP domain-containing sensor histidine kinase [Desulfuromonadales bacterium]|nr:HAMP domain-containing sensor histidine kinase [Desulfuromonadales bacterium]
MKRFDRFMSSLPVPAVLTGGALLVGVVGFLDFATGAELSISFFYLLPTCLVTWYVGRQSGIVISFLSAGVWLLADFMDVPAAFESSLIPYWNALMRLGFFLITTWVLSELQRNRARRRALERVFLHDILNVTGSLRGFIELLQDDAVVDKDAVYALIRSAVEQSIDEIESHRIMTAAEDLTLQVDPEPLQARALLEKVADLYRHQTVGRNRDIVLEDGEDILFASDPTLLTRVLGNLVKNALEASKPGDAVRIGYRTTNGGIEFRVWSRAPIPEEIKGRIFHRLGSGKGGRERGIGTYSVRLLTTLLGGEVNFSSEEGKGTTFFVRLPLSGAKASDLVEETLA